MFHLESRISTYIYIYMCVCVCVCNLIDIEITVQDVQDDIPNGSRMKSYCYECLSACLAKCQGLDHAPAQRRPQELQDRSFPSQIVGVKTTAAPMVATCRHSMP